MIGEPILETQSFQQIIARDVLRKDGFYVNFVLAGPRAQENTAYSFFYTANRPCEVLWAAEKHAIANTLPMSVNIVSCTDGTSVSSGSPILATPFDLTKTANLSQQYSKLGLNKTGATQLKQGDSLALSYTGSIDTILHLSITVYLKYLANGDYL